MLYDGAHVTCRIDLLVHDNAAKGNVALVHGVVKYLLKALFSLIVMVADHLFQREESVVKSSRSSLRSGQNNLLAPVWMQLKVPLTLVRHRLYDGIPVNAQFTGELPLSWQLIAFDQFVFFYHILDSSRNLQIDWGFAVSVYCNIHIISIPCGSVTTN